MSEVGGASRPGRDFEPASGPLILYRACLSWAGELSDSNSSGGLHEGVATCLQKAEDYKRHPGSPPPLNPTWSGGPGLASDLLSARTGLVIWSAPAVQAPSGPVFWSGCLGGRCLLLSKNVFLRQGVLTPSDLQFISKMCIMLSTFPTESF